MNHINKINIKRYLTPVIIIVLSLSLSLVTQAASSAKYTTNKVNKSKSYGNGRIKATVYYQKVKLKGNSRAVKQINKAIQKDFNDFLKSKNVKSLYSYAKQRSQSSGSDEYYNYANQKVTYNRNGVISIKVSTNWYAGGIHNTYVYGLNYSLKTGRRLMLNDVCKGSSNKIKDSIIKAIKKEAGANTSDYQWNTINSYSTNKFRFYLTKGKAKVCFEPYEIAFGGWSREYSIKSKYK